MKNIDNFFAIFTKIIFCTYLCSVSVFSKLGYVLKREVIEAVRLVNEIYVDGKRGSRKPKKRWRQ